MRFIEDKDNDTFPSILRDLMEYHPKTGAKTTQKDFGEYLGIRPQTVSLYAKGETQPTQETLCKMAAYFEVSLDYLLTGVSSENLDMNKRLGISEKAVKQIELVHDFGADEKGTDVFPLLNELLSDIEFYRLLASLISKKETIKGIQMLSEEDKIKKYRDIDIEGYHRWDMHKCIENFIIEQLDKHLN